MEIYYGRKQQELPNVPQQLELFWFSQTG
jgi:hypothetical protein